MKPVIAMPRMGNDPFRIYMKSKYVLSLRRAGAKVRWIPLNNIEEHLPELLQCDGLLMPGGVDIEPARYGQQQSEKCGKSDLLRDEAEWKILEAFLPAKKPVLCICRGHQLLNVFCGGTLHQHIRDILTSKAAARAAIRFTFSLAPCWRICCRRNKSQ